MRTALYRHYDLNNQLLYVGVSLNVLMRTINHACVSSWYDQVATIKIEYFENREIALKAETASILNEKPLYNIDQTYRRKVPRTLITDELRGMTYSNDEFAKIVGVSVTTIRKWAETDNNGGVQPVPNVTPYRWYKSQVDKVFGAGER